MSTIKLSPLRLHWPQLKITGLRVILLLI